MTERSATGGWPTPSEAVPADWPTVPGYEILEELGRGGMGVVYKARQVSLKRLVALKLIRDGALAGPQERARFRIEAEAAARMQHPNVVQIYEAGEHHGLLYFAMELVEGGSLDKHLAGQPQPAPLAAELVRTLARAVQHAHAQQVVHRDLKPANVL
ncbi:MAG: serine/threonine protein kinase, partial [Gemmataceae bacterium]|nr:serine/threonine protein kinase [Gemmataceae bacterium]